MAFLLSSGPHGGVPMERIPEDHEGFLLDRPFGFFAHPTLLTPLDMSSVVEARWAANGRDMVLCNEVVFVDAEGYVWRAMPGRVVNGKSSPRFVWRICPPYVGRDREASVIHDVACVDKLYPSPCVHRVFYWAMRARGVSSLRAWLRWAAVRFFGPRFRGDYPAGG
jgi:hypothetical protein